MEYKFNTPILFIAFNRVNSTKRVLDVISKVKPANLYVACDGPRINNCDDEKNVKEVRDLIKKKVDWDCNLHLLFHDHNLGCGKAVTSAINWFFSSEEQGIILEDDTLPQIDFFKFCEINLEQYKDNTSIGVISGSNLVSSKIQSTDSYFYSRTIFIWGWATWKRAWLKNDSMMLEWADENKRSYILNNVFNNNMFFRLYWKFEFNRVFKKELDTWDYQWLYSCWKNELYSIIPTVNLVTNIGFDSDATHTSGKTPLYVTQSKSGHIDFPLIKPSHFSLNKKLEKLIDSEMYNIGIITSFKIVVKLFLKKINF
jgi:hypothetical protein